MSAGSSSDPVVQILLEAAARGRELRRQREAGQQQAPRLSPFTVSQIELWIKQAERCGDNRLLDFLRAILAVRG